MRVLSEILNRQSHHLCLAPLRGVTDHVFRHCFARHFGGIDWALAPFIETVAGLRVKSSLLREPAASRTECPPVTPQILTKSVSEFAVMLDALATLGVSRVNLNAGCPASPIVRKGRGAGLLEAPERLCKLLEAGCARFPSGFSLKVRLGLTRADTLENLMPRLHAYPLAALIVHPRTAEQGYRGTVDLEAFARIAAICRHRLIYNGDIVTPVHLETLIQRFPSIRHWMIGRGLLHDPFLAERFRGMPLGDESARLQRFVCDYENACHAHAANETIALGRLKAMWALLAPALSVETAGLARIRRAQTWPAYLAARAPWAQDALAAHDGGV